MDKISGLFWSTGKTSSPFSYTTLFSLYSAVHWYSFKLWKSGETHFINCSALTRQRACEVFKKPASDCVFLILRDCSLSAKILLLGIKWIRLKSHKLLYFQKRSMLHWIYISNKTNQPNKSTKQTNKHERRTKKIFFKLSFIQGSFTESELAFFSGMSWSHSRQCDL